MSVQLLIKIIPGSSRTMICGWLGERLKIKVIAPPDAGKANREVIKLLAEKLKIPARHISLTSGTSSPYKSVCIESLEESVVHARLFD